MAIGTNTFLFPSDELNTSNPFSLKNDVSVVKVINLREGDYVCVEVEFGIDECEKMFVPYAPSCNGQLCFCYPQSEFILTVPNRYRLTLGNKDDLHLNDPSYFEEVQIIQNPVKGSNINIEACNMNCATPDKFAVAVTPNSPSGWQLVMNDGVQIPFTLTTGEGLEFTGTNLELDYTAICEGLESNGCITSVCDQVSNFPISTTPLGG